MAEIPAPFQHTVEAVLKAYEIKQQRFGDSRGVPMSNAANECSRAIWYQNRWAAPSEQIDGEKQSRFDTGNIWEERLLSDLELIGCEVVRVDSATGKQFQVELASGWLRGKMDGTVLGLPEAPKTIHVVECKSHSDRSFKELLKHAPPKGEGLIKSKPDHYAQCMSYCHSRGLTRCFYYAVNKDTDARYSERIAYDATFALALEAKIERIAKSDRAPARLFEDPSSKAAFACAWCPAKPQCHEGAFARVNCRTCLSADFRDGAEVWCSLTGKQLSYQEQQKGCSEHRYLPSLVPGEQTDANPATRQITYRLSSGKLWTDGADA